MIVVSKSADFPSLLTLIAAIAGTGISSTFICRPAPFFHLIYYSIVCIFTCCQADYPFIICVNCVNSQETLYFFYIL